MLSVVIPTLNAERHMARTLTALVPGALEGLVAEVIISDGGSTDRTLKIADEAGCDIVTSARGRGQQLLAGAKAARGEWLLFLHADTELDAAWLDAVSQFIERRGREKVGYFRFRLDEPGIKARLLERLVSLRCALFGLPYGDQGLLIHRALYDRIGGYRAMELMEDVDLVRRLGMGRLSPLPVDALTSAERYESGIFRRMARNMLCLSLYFLRVPPARIANLYNR